MTLLLTAVTPEGIVMGADSSLTFSSDDDELSLVGFPKIVPVPRLNMAISVGGAAEVEQDGAERWISTWLRDLVAQNEAASFTGFCEDFVDALNDLQAPRELNVFHCAAWARAADPDGEEHVVPRMAEVSNESGAFVCNSQLPDDFVVDLLSWDRGERGEGYPIRFVSSGLPRGFATWIREVGTPSFSQLVGASVPNPEVTSVAEYVRLLIRLIAELHRVARKNAYVGEPVETLLLFPKAMSMFSTRY